MNYDKFFIKGEVHTEADKAYTSHNTRQLNVEKTVKKLLSTEYIKAQLMVGNTDIEQGLF